MDLRLSKRSPADNLLELYLPESPLLEKTEDTLYESPALEKRDNMLLLSERERSFSFVQAHFLPGVSAIIFFVCPSATFFVELAHDIGVI